MHTVHSVKPEPLIDSSPSMFFLILLVTDNATFSYTDAGYRNILASSSDGINMQPYRREEAAKKYYAAIRDAREFVEGRLDLVAI